MREAAEEAEEEEEEEEEEGVEEEAKVEVGSGVVAVGKVLAAV
jgi:hypothetical protein